MTVNKAQQDIEVTQTEQTSNEDPEVEANRADEDEIEQSNWGFLLILWGILELFYFPVTGIVLIIWGTLTLNMRHRWMFIINGFLMLFIVFSNVDSYAIINNHGLMEDGFDVTILLIFSGISSLFNINMENF